MRGLMEQSSNTNPASMEETSPIPAAPEVVACAVDTAPRGPGRNGEDASLWSGGRAVEGTRDGAGRRRLQRGNRRI
jgi:hypothetical protein